MKVTEKFSHSESSYSAGREEKEKKKERKNSTTSLEGFQSVLVCDGSTQSAENCGHITTDLERIFHMVQVN